ncbi:MAG: PAS domain-containing protein [Mucilaginibacter sp.]
MSNAWEYHPGIMEAFISSGKDLIGIINSKGEYTYVGPSVTKALGVDPAYFIGKSFAEFVHPDDLPKLMGYFHAILQGAKELQIPLFRFQKNTGDWIWVETYANNYLDDPLIAGVIVNSRDITDKVNDELVKGRYLDELRSANERYSLVMQATNDIIWESDLTVYSKKYTPSRTFFKQSEVLNGALYNGWETYLHPEDKKRVIKNLKAAILSPDRNYWKDEYRFLNPEGDITYIIDQAYIVRNEERKAIRMVGAMHNNTPVKERESKIICQNRQLREIADINSHEIRRPVANILGLISILDKHKIHPENKLIIDYLFQSTQELDDIIKKISQKTAES